jgi:hypothetical protein
VLASWAEMGRAGCMWERGENEKDKERWAGPAEDREREMFLVYWLWNFFSFRLGTT